MNKKQRRLKRIKNGTKNPPSYSKKRWRFGTCPHCNSFKTECMVHQTPERDKFYYCLECSGSTWEK